MYVTLYIYLVTERHGVRDALRYVILCDALWYVSLRDASDVMRRQCHICHIPRHICDARDETSYVTDVTLVM